MTSKISSISHDLHKLLFMDNLSNLLIVVFKLSKSLFRFPKSFFIIKSIIFAYIIYRYSFSVGEYLLTNDYYKSYHDYIVFKYPLNGYLLIGLYLNIIDIAGVLNTFVLAIILSVFYHKLKILYIIFLYYIISFYQIIWQSYIVAYYFETTLNNVMLNILGYSSLDYIIYLILRAPIYLLGYYLYQYIYNYYRIKLKEIEVKD